MSPLMRQFVAGQLAYAREITWFLAPYVNSYKRFQVGTFAPTQAIWSLDNRTAGFRLCGADTKAIRIECRSWRRRSQSLSSLRRVDCRRPCRHRAESDARTRAMSAMPTRTRACEKCRRRCARRRNLMKSSKMLRQAFGDGVIDHYVHTAEWEQFEYDRRITDWELKRGFERY